MKHACVLALAVALPACTIEQPVTATTIVSSVTPEQTAACVAAGAEARNVDAGMVTATSARATTTGPIVMLSVAGETASCKLDELGAVESVTFG